MCKGIRKKVSTTVEKFEENASTSNIDRSLFGQDPNEVLGRRFVNKYNIFKEPVHDEKAAVMTDVILSFLYPFVLIAIVLLLGWSQTVSDPFDSATTLISTAGAEMPYPPHGLSSEITCRAPGGCLAISFFNEAPPERSSVCFQRMTALRQNKCVDDNTCNLLCPSGNCCYHPKTNPKGGFLCDDWVFLSYNQSLFVDWCYSSRSNEGVFVFWGYHGGMGFNDSNVYEQTNRRGKAALKCQYISQKGSYMNEFLTRSCPPSTSGNGQKDSDYTDEKCKNICGIRDMKSGNAIYPEGLSVTNIVMANDPTHIEISPKISEDEYRERTKSQTSFSCPDLMKTGYCQKHEPIGAGTVLIKLENKTFVGWTGKYRGLSRDGYYQDVYETYVYVDHVGKGDVIQSYPVVMEEASGKAPPSVVKCAPRSGNQAAPTCSHNHDAFEDFIYNVPKDMDLLGTKTNWADLGITNDFWLGAERCKTGVGPNDRRLLQSDQVESKERRLPGATNSNTPTQQQINNCIMRERRLFMQTHLRMSKLKVDVSYSQSVFRQHKLYHNIPVLLGSMQGLLMAVFGGLAIILRKTPCMQAEQRKSDDLHRQLQLAYVGGSHVENNATATATKVSKYIVTSDEASCTDTNLLKFEEKLRKLETQIQQLKSGSIMTKAAVS